MFNQTEPPRWVDAWPHYASVGIIYFSQKHNDSLLSSGTTVRLGIFVVANLRSYPLSCTDAIVGILALNLFCRSTTAEYA